MKKQEHQNAEPQNELNEKDDFLSEEEIRAEKYASEEVLESIYEDMEPEEAEEETEKEYSGKGAGGEDISIKEGERIGLGLRSMQTQADILKRKKRRKKKIIIILLILLIIIIGIVVYQIKKTQAEDTTVESSEDVVAGENQEIILGEISEINGNEMTFTLVEEEETTEQSTEMQSTADGQEQAAEAPNSEQSSADTEEMSTDGGQMPDMSSGQMPDMGELPSDGEAGTEAGTASDQPMPQAMTETKTYRSLGEERTATIPVGTDVITKLGTTTTFARLAAGDVVQMLTEKAGDEDVIIKMWIVG